MFSITIACSVMDKVCHVTVDVIRTALGICSDGENVSDLIDVNIFLMWTLLGMSKLRFKPAYNPYTEPSMEIFRCLSHILLLMVYYSLAIRYNIDLIDHFWFLSVIMKAWRNGWKLVILACSDLKCCFQWDSLRMFVLLLGAFPLKGKNWEVVTWYY